MSGFFMLRRGFFQNAVRELSGQGFKILLDLLASSPRPLVIRELPYEFRERRHGESKLDTVVAWEFMMLISESSSATSSRCGSPFSRSSALWGSPLHLAALWAVLRLAGQPFAAAQAKATMAAMTSNFFLNNLFTYRDQRLKGWRALRGLLYPPTPSARLERRPTSASRPTCSPPTKSGGSSASPG
jgi:dolichol-phosphate mannosyltransferase